MMMSARGSAKVALIVSNRFTTNKKNNKDPLFIALLLINSILSSRRFAELMQVKPERYYF
jgi:hypothetical protein